MTAHNFHQTKVKTIHFFNKIENRHQTHPYTSNYFSSDHQHFYQNQRPHSYHKNQPDIFKPYTQEQLMRQPRPSLKSQYKNFQSQNPASTHSYQPTHTQNEIPLLYYLQQHEITKSQLTNFSQMTNAHESLQMTMNLYLMGGSSITSNKPLRVFTGTDPEHSVEKCLNAVTATLILNIGPEPINTPLNRNWIHSCTALIQTTLDGAALKGFQFYL